MPTRVTPSLLARLLVAGLTIGLAVGLASCAEGPAPAGGPATAAESGDRGPSGAEVAAALGAMPTTERLVPLRKGDLVRMPGGPADFVEGWTVLDSRFPCDQPGIECGALVEVWGSPESAQRRSEEMLSLTGGMLPRDAEQHVVRGSVVVRMRLALTRREVASYEAALDGA
ncbi:hypothetical protein [Nocardioides deserti]|uniref:Uncharacterized protein n=1 Tax=Nocardioides deserti TaxID=1588644 RepID=A0ABR6U823_9ACTN|nr:hypothetical protein [Nocardioides deserti]MBC2960571.1 hypothetical protein [Nocardioides deserti]GGO70987.1 hypothetical protein GCM10012276_10880 [Nocardioides deserti]